MTMSHRASMLTLGLLIALPAFTADSLLVVDRGLPQSNLNNASGPARSNVRWGWHEEGFLGDDFTVGAAGEHWVIDSIRTWSVPGGKGATLPHLGDYYQDVRLYFGEGDVTPVLAAQMRPDSDDTSNANVSVSDATANGALLYDDFGTPLRIWQVDFTHLDLAVQGGTRYRFGVWGHGRPVPGDQNVYSWYNHASNAGLSGNRQDGADGMMLLFDAAGRAQGTHKAEGNGWDKQADINVQVYAHRVESEPTKATRR
jgi:hypothetical protein